jgi:hypothetical protein
MKKLVKLPSLSRVTPGSKATLELPLGNTYERIILVATAGAGLDATDINRIDVLVNGSPIQTFKNLQRLIDINTYYNRDADTIAATRIEAALHFSRAELIDQIWRKAPGLGTADIQTLHLEIEIAAGAPADIAIVAYAQVNPIREALGAFFRIREFPASSAVAGILEADKLPRGAWYSAIHLFKADVSNVEVVANDVKIIDATKAVLERFQKGASPVKRVPQTAKATHIDFITDGDLLDSLPTANLSDFRVKMTLDTSGGVDIITETVDTLSR